MEQTEETTSIPALLDRTIISEVSGGRKGMLQGCMRIIIIGWCMCCITRLQGINFVIVTFYHSWPILVYI
jgi:hypothetical protein